MEPVKYANKKPVLYIFEAVVLLLVFYLIYKILIKNKDRTVANDISALQKAGQEATYSDSQYSAFADALFKAVSRVTGNPDREKTHDIFKQMKNDIDVLKLIQAFGTRTYLSWKTSGWKDSLSEFLNGHFSKSEVQQINAILEINGVIFRF